MSNRTLRRRNTPVTNIGKTTRSTSFRRLTRASNIRRSFSRPLKRSKSESNLSTFAGFHVNSCEDDRNISSREDFLLGRPHTCIDVLESKSLPSPGIFERYKKEAKVVVNVTVEGSPGPVRTMVKLAANVEETIRLVINKYGEEGRTPLLDKDAVSKYQLHHSHFSLASLSMSDVIGDVGSRSFYLRKGNYNPGDGGIDIISASFTSDIILARSDTPSPDPSPIIFLSSLIYQTISKMIRRTGKIWKIFGCFEVN